MKTEALFTDPEEKIVIEPVELGELPDTHVHVKVHYSYISAGTELTALQMGHNLNTKADVSRRQLGYSCAGSVLSVGQSVAHVKPGDLVACVGQGAFHSREVHVARNLVVPLPTGIDCKQASPAAMMCFALEGVRKAQLRFGENVLVTGAGPMGQFASQMAVLTAGEVFLLDINAGRLEKAVAGVTPIFGDDAGWAKIEDMSAPHGIEAVLFCLGGEKTSLFERVKTVMSRSPDGLLQGRIVFSGGATITTRMASVSGNLQLLSSAKAGPGYRDAYFESGSDYPQAYVPFTVQRNVQALLRAVVRGMIDVNRLITHEYPFADALSAYEKLATKNTDALAVVLKYE